MTIYSHEVFYILDSPLLFPSDSAVPSSLGARQHLQSSCCRRGLWSYEWSYKDPWACFSHWISSLSWPSPLVWSWHGPWGLTNHQALHTLLLMKWGWRMIPIWAGADDAGDLCSIPCSWCLTWRRKLMTSMKTQDAMLRGLNSSSSLVSWWDKNGGNAIFCDIVIGICNHRSSLHNWS